MIDEKSLMLKVKDGQIGYLSELFEANHIALFNFYLRMGLNRALSEDLVQETFMRILAYRTTFMAHSSFKAWFYRIARNVVADHFRKMSNQDIHDSFNDESIQNENMLTDGIERESQHNAFEQALNKLEVEHREIIVLSRFQQLSYQEIAELLNCNINTLKTRMRAAISKLKNEYQLITGEATL
ncbi:MAG: RNA polymerase sigma factor [Kangiellaceae bacterium]|nr:RNA polymerase sigma factor [Kangiellaceae bacterium]MCW8997659.1 RNA polymerase sigma factor [Kangiellaceae bacterium]MCW9017886.1 RNA polymerase sigma factor [Kangiellaceae bacterium]